jgi:FAD:protein FMN transferase
MLTRCRPMLGTFVEVSVPEAAQGCIDDAFAAVAAVDTVMSFHKETSDLARIRRAPVGQAIAVSSATISVLRFAAGLYADTNGLFDVTIGREMIDAGHLPRPIQGPDICNSGNCDDLEIIDDTHLRCHRPLLIDLGGIAKGYAVDCAIEILRAKGVDNAVVNAGGDLRVLGDEPQTIWLRDAAGYPGAAIALANGAVATSSNNQGRRIHFGYDRTALLGKNAVTVLAPTCMEADAFTKIALADMALAGRLLGRRYGTVLIPDSLKVAA